MQLYLSPTALGDYIQCSKRLYYRIRLKETGEESEEKTLPMKIGIIVHSMIEKFPGGYQKEELDKLLKENAITDTKAIKKIDRCLTSFYDDYAIMTCKDDIVEKTYRLKWSDDVTIVGKMDRILDTGTIIDWKTGDTPITSIDADIQFMMYYMAYQQMFNHAPRDVLYINLNYRKVVKLTYNERNFKALRYEIIPKAIESIRYGKFYREGLFTGKCETKSGYICPFRTLCWSEV